MVPSSVPPIHPQHALVGGQHRLHHGGGQLAVRGLHGADLVARGLDGPGLMEADVGCGGGDDRLVGPEERGDGQKVCLGAAGEEVDVRLRGLADPADGLPGGLAQGVQGVAAGLGEIGVHQALEDFRVGSLAVVVAEAVHGTVPLFQKVTKQLPECYGIDVAIIPCFLYKCKERTAALFFRKKGILKSGTFFAPRPS